MPEYICSSCGNSFEAEPDGKGKIFCVSCGMDMSAAEALQPLAAGTRISGYEIIRHIAAGGSGSVYLAEQIAMGRSVALKILDPGRVNKNRAGRFLEEARNTAKFENPHVVSVIDSGISPDGYYYIAMQYVEGETLEEILRRGRTFSEAETLTVGITVAEALGSIWNKCQMFHKDIKPANIMLTPENEAMILDMGTAQGYGKSTLADGDIEGSPYYMSPEQARGEPLTWSTDLYSLGATMYQMVTGVYPYDASEVEEILQMHDSAPFPDPAERVPEIRISERMTALLQRMMGKTPAERYASWEDFIREARNLEENIRKQKGHAVSKPLRKPSSSLNFHATKPVLKHREKSGIRTVCFGLAIFILAAALLSWSFLYLAVQKNSVNARHLLEPIRRQANSLQMNPDALEATIREAAPYFQRFGVLPSVREEFEKCKRKVAEFRERVRTEATRINALESRTADSLGKADLTGKKAKAAAEKNQKQAEAYFHSALAILEGTAHQVRNTVFVLPQNISRAEQLKKRLSAAQESVQRELLFFQRVRTLKIRKPQNRPVPPQSASVPEKEKKPLSPGKPAAAVSPAPPRSDRSPEEQRQRLVQTLEQEKNRIRILLLQQPMPGKISPGNPLFQSVGGTAVPDELNRPFERWRTHLKKTAGEAGKLWNAVYNSHQRLAGFHFTIMTSRGEVRMELKTILRDTMILYHREMPNIRLRFQRLPQAEWLDFLHFAADRLDLRQELNSYLLLDGWFFQVEENANRFIRSEMPVMRQIYYRFLSGEDFPGIDGRIRPGITEILRKYQSDPAFAPFRARLLKRHRNRNHQPKRS